MSRKEKRREALRLGKKDMSFTEIMQGGRLRQVPAERRPHRRMVPGGYAGLLYRAA